MRPAPLLCALALLASAFAPLGSAARAQSAATRAASAAAPKTTQALVAEIRAGQPDAVTDQALEMLAKTPRREALELLAELTQHRRAGARLRAYRAIAALQARSAALQAQSAAAQGAASERSKLAALLARGLDDSDAAVRGACASALGEHGVGLDGDAIAKLLRALARGVPEAGHAVGAVAPEAALANVHESLAGLPMQTRLDTYEALLKRDAVSERAKLDVIARIGEIASPLAKQFLMRLIAERAFAKRPTLQNAATETAKRIVAVPSATKAAAQPAERKAP